MVSEFTSDEELWDLAVEDIKELAKTIDKAACRDAILKFFNGEQKVIGFVRLLMTLDAMETAHCNQNGLEHQADILNAAAQIRFQWLRFYRDLPDDDLPNATDCNLRNKPE